MAEEIDVPIITTGATIVSQQTKPEKRLQRRTQQNNKVRITVKFMDRIYNTPLEKILGNPTMLTRILKNGYYRQALCDANNMATMTINFNGEDHILYGIPDNMKDTKRLVYGEYDWVKAVDVEIDETGE
jgi:hypothetical protein